MAKDYTPRLHTYNGANGRTKNAEKFGSSVCHPICKPLTSYKSHHRLHPLPIAQHRYPAGTLACVTFQISHPEHVPVLGPAQE